MKSHPKCFSAVSPCTLFFSISLCSNAQEKLPIPVVRHAASERGRANVRANLEEIFHLSKKKATKVTMHFLNYNTGKVIQTKILKETLTSSLMIFFFTFTSNLYRLFTYNAIMLYIL